MGLFSKKDINKGIEEYKNTKDAFLVDVRTIEEYEEAYIDGSINIPLSEIEKIVDVVKDKEASIFVYCHSGARASIAKSIMEKLGYRNVKNIGGIENYKGETLSK